MPVREDDRVSLYYREGSSDKEYNVEIRPHPTIPERFNVEASWGRRGNASQRGQKNKSPLGYGAARSLMQDLIDEKRRKGYDYGPESVRRSVQVETASVHPTGYLPMLLNAVSREEIEALVWDHLWLFQPKWDGVRVLLHRTGTNVHGISRTKKLVAIPDPVKEVALGCPRNFVIDGELIDDHLIVFDILRDDDLDLAGYSCETRVKHVKNMFETRDYGILVSPTAYLPEDKEKMLKTLFEKGWEGIVAKRMDAPYKAGRPNSGGPALKCKFWNTGSFIVDSHNEERSVNVKLYDGRDMGSVTIPPNKAIPVIGSVIECRYLYIHDVGGKLIQPTFLCERFDIQLHECTAEQLQVKGTEREGE